MTCAPFFSAIGDCAGGLGSSWKIRPMVGVHEGAQDGLWTDSEGAVINLEAVSVQVSVSNVLSESRLNGVLAIIQLCSFSFFTPRHH